MIFTLLLQALLQTAKYASERLQQQAQAILGHAPNISRQDSKSLLRVIKLPKAAAYDLAAFRAGGCDWAAIQMAGFTAAEAKTAGCDLATAKSAGYDASSLVVEFGFDAVVSAGCDVSFILVSRMNAQAHVRTRTNTHAHTHTNTHTHE